MSVLLPMLARLQTSRKLELPKRPLLGAAEVEGVAEAAASAWAVVLLVAALMLKALAPGFSESKCLGKASVETAGELDE